MNTSLYDFDTRFAPFEGFAPLAPYAPLALMGWFAAPAQWWANAFLTSCSLWSDAMVTAMTYPYALPEAAFDMHAKNEEKPRKLG